MLFRELKIRNWTILFIFAIKNVDEEAVLGALESAGAPDGIIAHTKGNLRKKRLDEGFSYSNPVRRISVAYVGPVSSGEQFLNTAIHELYHLTQDLGKAEGLDPYGESTAYLAGDLSSNISDILCRYSCDKCREAS